MANLVRINGNPYLRYDSANNQIQAMDTSGDWENIYYTDQLPIDAIVPDPVTFYYTGGIQSYTVTKTGIYQLEVWGAQSGGRGTNVGNKGGYAKGNVRLTKDDVIYIVVGGRGGAGGYPHNSTYTAHGGYNGGGSTTTTATGDDNWPNTGGGGGGATHIGKTNAILKNTPVADLFIVAGGAGSAWGVGSGGAGGGLTGGNGSSETGGVSGTGGGGGTQTTGGTSAVSGGQGSYGQGGSCTFTNNVGHGGGGGYYGGGAGYGAGGDGGGGSGYTDGCINGTTSMESGVRSGDGQAKITWVSIS